MTKGMKRSSERGAILIHVAVGLLVLVGFTTFVVDYGILWVSRTQAQNAADAGALAGATALAYNNHVDLSDTGPAKQGAWRATQDNFVWGQPPAVDISTDITFPACPDGSPGPCIRVDVYRNQARGNPLPMFFGRLLGITAQGVRATATARAMSANSSQCLKPWGIPDRWIENYPVPGPWTELVKFDKYAAPPASGLLPNPDIYVQPTETDPGTGFTLAVDRGRRMTLKVGSPQDAIAPGFFYALKLGDQPGGAAYRYNIANCVGVPLGIGDRVSTEPGNMQGPTRQGVEDLIALDPNAYWNPLMGSVAGSCFPSACPGYGRSPRIVLVPIFHTEDYEDGRQTGRLEVQIVNILGFFLENVTANTVEGYFMIAGGDYSGSHGTINDQSAFARTIALVQ